MSAVADVADVLSYKGAANLQPTQKLEVTVGQSTTNQQQQQPTTTTTNNTQQQQPTNNQQPTNARVHFITAIRTRLPTSFRSRTPGDRHRGTTHNFQEQCCGESHDPSASRTTFKKNAPQPETDQKPTRNRPETDQKQKEKDQGSRWTAHLKTDELGRARPPCPHADVALVRIGVEDRAICVVSH